MQFVYQIMNQQVIPEQAAQDHKNVFARLLFERGNLRVCVRSFNDARIFPRG